MYLYKHPNSVYYTRICPPKKLVALGFPFDFKISLRTKERSEALRRNLVTAPIVIQSLDSVLLGTEISKDCLRQFKSDLNKLITSSWQQWGNPAALQAPTLKTTPQIKSKATPSKLPLKTWLAEFTDYKTDEGVTLSRSRHLIWGLNKPEAFLLSKLCQKWQGTLCLECNFKTSDVEISPIK
ncbi:hypothetical protein VAE063_1000079 [Vibrio aestuarianus]|uniref:Uncharacterized protein n=1 Tax=Vibrio aestuarianus TaxID=28171 RepID=A0ABN8TIS5_9VIBR|nr:hypothetical protein VAE063_1000079 [Vibrio aestuarianus]